MNREEVILEVAKAVRQYGMDLLLYLDPDYEEVARSIVNFLDSINYEFNKSNVEPV